MFRLSTLSFSLLLCLLAGPAGAQILGGGVGKLIGSGVGGQSSTAGSIAAGGGGTLTGDSIGATVDLNFVANTGFTNGLAKSASSMITTTRAGTAYADDTNGNWTAFATNVARITNKGLLVEEARTNSVTNNSMQGAVPGLGNLPTNWNQSQNTGITPNLIAVGTSQGMDFVTYRFTGTVSPGNNNNIFFEVGAIPATSGQAWTGSYFYRMSAGSMNNIGSLQIIVNAPNGNQAAVLTPTSSWQRATITTTSTGTGNVQFAAQLQPTVGQSIDISIDFAWPQVELGSFPTSPIRTTGSSVTRAADVVSLSALPTIGTSATMFASATPTSPVAYANYQSLMVLQGNSTGWMNLVRAASNGTATLFTSAGLSAGTVWQQSTPSKVAAAQAVGSQGISFNGGVVAGGTNASVFPPAGETLISVNIGGLSPPSQDFDGYIQRVALWASNRISNPGLQALTYTSGILQGDGVQAAIDLNFVTGQGWNQGVTGPVGTSYFMSFQRATDNTVGSYAQDTSGKWIKFADNVPRITNRGILIEEQRSNIINYAATFATNWFVNAPNQGAPSTDLPAVFPGAAIWKGVYGGTGDSNVGFSGGAINVTTSTTYTLSAWVYIPSGPNAATYVTFGVEGASCLTAAVTANPGLLDQWQYLTFTTTTAASGSTNGSPVFRIGGPTGATVYFTGIQLEAGAFATSFIPAVAGPTRRFGDAVTLDNILPAPYNPMALFMSGRFIDPAAVSEGSDIYMGWAVAATATNDVVYAAASGSNIAVIGNTGGTAVIGVGDGAMFQQFKVAFSTATGSTNVSSNGAVGIRTAQTPTGAAITSIAIGTAPWGPGLANTISAYVTRFAVIPNNISDAGLINLTTGP